MKGADTNGSQEIQKMSVSVLNASLQGLTPLKRIKGDVMARPQKAGLDYFPLDTDMDNDDKTVLVESRYGLEGFAILIKLMMKIYKTGYYYKWTERERLLFSKRIGANEKLISDIVRDCIEWEFFDKKMFMKYQILTSKGIQKRFFEAVKRRLRIDVYMMYTLIDVYAYINEVNVNINSINDDTNPQRKEKKRKEENIYSEVVDHLNKKADRKYKDDTPKTRELIKARLNEGFTLDDFKKVIDNKVITWKGDNGFDKFLRPETLFGNKFESYLNEKEITKSKEIANDYFRA